MVSLLCPDLIHSLLQPRRKRNVNDNESLTFDSTTTDHLKKQNARIIHSSNRITLRFPQTNYVAFESF